MSIENGKTEGQHSLAIEGEEEKTCQVRRDV